MNRNPFFKSKLILTPSSASRAITRKKNGFALLQPIIFLDGKVLSQYFTSRN
jgi:hypothetical protein